jgi:leader peptidase (prepilin peptidase) / N-methyltransferase
MNLQDWKEALTPLVFIYGAVLGSFLNVCIWRIPRNESVVHPRSRCPGCGTMIAWFDNIPILSWLALRARCRRCGMRISARYPAVELLTALLFAAIWGRFGFDGRTPVYWLAAAGLVLGTFVDLDHFILPDRVTWGGIIAGLALSPLVPALHGADTPLRGLSAAAIGAAAGFGLLWLVAKIGERTFKKEAMGFGDVKLMGAVGAVLGWPAVLFTIFVSSLTGALTGLTLIALRKHEWQSRIPFGPFIALAAMLWILGGSDWTAAYIDWLTGAEAIR